MQERLKQIWSKIVAFWNKYSRKQKTIVISVAVAVILAIVILAMIINKVSYATLMKCENTTIASEAIDMLEEQGIDCKLADDYVTVLVAEGSLTDAVIAVGSSDLSTSEYSYEDALTNSMSTTESEKALKTNLALQSDVRAKLMKLNGIEDAVVYINKPVDDYTIMSEGQDASVSVMLTLKGDSALSTENAEYVATFLAGIVGNKNTDNITIIDSNSNLLFGGNSDNTLGGNVNSVLDYKEKLSNNIVNNVKQVLLKYGSYKDVEVGAANIKFDMNKVTELYTEYTPAEGQEQGLYSKHYTYKTQGSNGTGGQPGTDSNDDDTNYQIENNTGANSSSETNQEEFLPNQKQTTTEYEVGAVVPAESSMAIVLTSYTIYKEEDVEEQGLLDDMTWNEYKRQNQEKTETEVDEKVAELVKSATGIDTKNITVTAWNQPIFQDKEESETNYDLFIMIGLIVLIVGLLIFVVFRVAKPVEVTEQEPELSVEELLATTKENQELEDIEFSEKSETRVMIEKFVDENPEAVAQLLRNWLNEDWG